MNTMSWVGLRRLIGFLALAAMLSFAACKKDEAAPADKPTGAAGEKVEKATAEPAAQAEGKTGTEKADPAKTGETKPEAGQPVGKEPSTAPKTLAAAQLQAIPEQVIVYGSVRSFDDLLATVRAVAEKVSPVPPPAGLDQMMLQALQGGLGFQAVDWFDKTRPARIVVLNPKTNPQPAVLVLPITDAEAVKKALPAEKKENDGGNQFSYTHDFQTFYANLTEKDLVLTQSPEAFALVKDFVATTLVGHTPDVPFELTVAMNNIQKIFGQELAMAEAQVAQMASMQMMMPMPGLQDVLKKEYALIFAGIREMERIDIAFAMKEGRLQLPMTFTVKTDGGIAKFLKGMAGRQVELAGLLPAASYFVMAYNMDPKSASAWTDLGFEFIGKAFQLEGEKLTKLRSLYDRSLDVTTGEAAFAMYRDGSFSFAFDAVYGINDAKTAREVHLAFYGAIWNELVALAKTLIEKEGGQIPPQFDLSSFPAAITSLNAMSAPMGITIALSSEEYKGATIDFLDLKVDFSKLPPMGADEKAIVESIVGDHFQFALAYGNGFMFETLSPNAVARVKQAIDGAKPLAGDASFAHVQDLLKDGGGALFLDPVKGLKAFSTVPELAPMKEAIDAQSPKGGLVIETEATAANQLRVTLELATEPISQIVKMFSGM